MKRMLFGACLVMTACAPGSPAPSTIRLGEDACAHCRMTIVGIETAAQIVSPGAEPIVFDEIGCLRAYLAEHQAIPQTGGQIATRYDLFFPENKSRMSFRLTELQPYIQQKRVRIPNPGSFAFPEEPGVKKQIEIQ